MTLERKLIIAILVIVLLFVIVFGGVGLWRFVRNNFLMSAELPESDVVPVTMKAETSLLSTPVPTEVVNEPVESDPVEAVSAVSEATAGEFFQTPVEATDTFNEESSWLIAEPGVILDDTAAFVIPSVKAEHYANIPEGGFTYFSLGEGIITIDGISLVLPGAEGLNYLVLIRGRIDDTIVDFDLNLTATVVEFLPGHAIWSIMPPGAYVSKGWFGQQLVTSTTTGGTNCGATGCTTVHVVLFDVDSHVYQKFEVKADNLDTWKLLESN